ncbi:SRPBCC family protein [Actinomarinicola tropica]|uniref:Polyketide cyclase n=1 Tax=Actinomarinicola tropica TaxID=2789776 RepID=A0A5Q2RDA8_9ACTN|nr:polyketide cyclase [Actinomarinicola tropica]QGG93694.1 polyketide cyclase [Actinomarinicola tropica]
MSAAERIAATRRVAAPAGRIFAVVSHPQGHVDIDGSGMLEAAPDATPLTEVGQAFTMHMDREPLGDLPMGKYTVLNRVTRIEPDRLVEWSVGSTDHPKPLGHVYGWELVALDDGTTEVTNYCDWSGLNPKLRDRITFPIVPLEMLERSVERLAVLLADD